MLTLQQRQRLKVMGIDVWSLRDGNPAPTISVLTYWIIDVFIANRQKVVSFVCQQGDKPEPEKELLQAIASAAGELRSDIRADQAIVGPGVVAFGPVAMQQAMEGAKLECQLDYTVEQMLKNKALKRPVWQQLQQYMSQ